MGNKKAKKAKKSTDKDITIKAIKDEKSSRRSSNEILTKINNEKPTSMAINLNGSNIKKSDDATNRNNRSNTEIKLTNNNDQVGSSNKQESQEKNKRDTNKKEVNNNNIA